MALSLPSVRRFVKRRYNASGTPNYPEITNISSGPNEDLIGRVIAAYDRFYASIARLHAPHVIELSLTLAQLKALYLIASSGSMRMSEVAERLGTAASTTSEVVHGLVQLGLLERLEDPADRRQVLVRPTPAAAERLEDFSRAGPQPHSRAAGARSGARRSRSHPTSDQPACRCGRSPPKGTEQMNWLSRAAVGRRSVTLLLATRPLRRRPAGLGEPQAGAPARRRVPGRDGHRAVPRRRRR